MIVSGRALSVPYRDACAADLRLSFAFRRHAALRTTVLHLGDLAVELRILGASHQVLVGAHGRVVVAETVACELGGDPLPAVADLTDRGWTIRFSSRVRTLGGGAFAVTVGRLHKVLARCPCALAAVFPGDELAMTGLRARSLASGGIAWRTWHAYPQTRELVTTWSSARPEESS
jgi:hypothetical protein